MTVRTKTLAPFLAISAATLVTFLLLHPSSPEVFPQSAQPEPPGPASYGYAPAPRLAVTAQEPFEVPTNHQTYVERRTAELQDLATENDAASLTAIVSELTNRDRDIRAAALEAAIQFGSRDAIPGLMDAATQIDDLAERAEINKAIEYLTLPTISEARLTRKQ